MKLLFFFSSISLPLVFEWKRDFRLLSRYFTERYSRRVDFGGFLDNFTRQFREIDFKIISNNKLLRDQVLRDSSLEFSLKSSLKKARFIFRFPWKLIEEQEPVEDLRLLLNRSLGADDKY